MVSPGQTLVTADVVIAGAGAAGAFYAARLAKAGKKVIVLEAGPPWTMGDLTSSQIWSRRLRWGGPPVTSGGSHPFGYGFNAGWGFGGAALHHYGTWPRMHPEDFKSQSLYGKGADWPIAYDDLRPYYDRIQQEVGLSGDARLEIWGGKKAPYPLPPLRQFNQAKLIRRGFDALGMNTAPMPMAILSEDYNGRPACLYDGWCDSGCPIYALWNPLVSDMPMAEEHGAEFRAYSHVTRVLLDKKDRAKGVEYYDSGGNRHEIHAGLVILAASVVQNPVILLNSVSDFYPYGIANDRGLVGRNFMTHIVSLTYGLFREETENHMGVTGAQLTSRDGYDKVRDGGPYGSYQWLIAPAIKPNDLLGIATSRVDLYGPALRDFMERAARHLGHMISMGEELPDPENRIALTDRKDRFGARTPTLIHSFSENSQALWRHMVDEGRRVFEAAGAQDIWTGPLASAHMLGGTPMGDSPATSITDSYGRVHGMTNLVITGSGLFPTGGGVNPTFTIYALSLRSVENLLEN